MRTFPLWFALACTTPVPTPPSRFVVVFDRSDGFLDAGRQRCAQQLSPVIRAIVEHPGRTGHGTLVVYATGTQGGPAREPLGTWTLGATLPSGHPLEGQDPARQAAALRAAMGAVVDAATAACEALTPAPWSPIADAVLGAALDLQGTCLPGQTCALYAVTDGLETARPGLCAAIHPGRRTPCAKGATPEIDVGPDLSRVAVTLCGLDAGADAAPGVLVDAVSQARERAWRHLLLSSAGGPNWLRSCDVLAPPPPVPTRSALSVGTTP